MGTPARNLAFGVSDMGTRRTPGFLFKKKSCFIEFLIWDRDSRQPLSEKVSFQRKEKTYFQEYSLGKKREICVDIYFSV